jgi:hypothetical protein
MLIILTIFAALLATAIVIFAKRRSAYLLEENKPNNLPPVSEFRPLFEPGPEELRAAEREEEARIEAEKAEESKREHQQKLAGLAELCKSWRAEPSRKNTIELLYLASQCESGKIYSETAHEAAKLWKNGQIRGLSADDLSQLLESHLWLLPAGERTSGVSFSIQHEIADLRSTSKENK